MGQSEDLAAMGQALISGTGYTPAQVPDMKGLTFFGARGDVMLWTQFVGALTAIDGANDRRTDRLTKIVRRTDELAEEKPELVLGRLKREIKDLGPEEVMFLVGYLFVGHGIMATPAEEAPEPVAPVQKAVTVLPGKTVLNNANGAPKGGGAGPAQDPAQGSSGAGRPDAAAVAAAAAAEARAAQARARGDAAADEVAAAFAAFVQPVVAPPAPVVPKKPGPTSRPATAEELAGGPKKGHGEQADKPHAPAASTMTPWTIFALCGGIALLIAACGGSIGFVVWISS